jgi:hypothetical protein
MRNKKLVNESVGAKPKERSKTGIARKLAMGVPLVASASGVKGGRGANRAFGALTGVTAAKSGVKVDPLGVAMALPVFKLVAAARALRAAGRIQEASALAARVAAKEIGQTAGRGVPRLLTGQLRAQSEVGRVYPRISGAMSGEFRGMNAAEITATIARTQGRQLGVPIENIAEASAAARKSVTGFTAASKKMAAAAAAAKKEAAAAARYRARVEGTRVTELENRLNFGWAKKGRRSK